MKANDPLFVKTLTNYHGTFDIGCAEMSALTQHEVIIDTSDALPHHEQTDLSFTDVDIHFQSTDIGLMATYLRTQIPEQLLIVFFHQLMQCALDDLEAAQEQQSEADWQAANTLLTPTNVQSRTYADHIHIQIGIPGNFDLAGTSVVEISNAFYLIARTITNAYNLKLDFEPTLASYDGRTVTMRMFWLSPVFD